MNRRQKLSAAVQHKDSFGYLGVRLRQCPLSVIGISVAESAMNSRLSEARVREVKDMNILSGFFTEDLAIDLGTVNTIVYTPTQGVVLNEPSVVAVNKYSREVISVGSPALKLLGREPKDRKSTRLNSSHSQISYAVFCLKK